MNINPKEKETIIADIILLWILRHGGEWPDWGDPDGQFVVNLIITIQNMAKKFKDKKASVEIQRAIERILRVEKNS